nr:TetR/AcrR family transcriptional regulator [uncultured Caproiciproducens sp.]
MGNEKIRENKRIKMTKLYDAAYDLFTSNGVHNTVIDDIVKSAGVAKGTFYLYCKDKYDLVDKIILKKSAAILSGTMEEVEKEEAAHHFDFQQSVACFVDYLVEYFKKDTKLLELIYKNLTYELYEKMMHDEEMDIAIDAFISNFVNTGVNNQTAQHRLYVIVSMVSAVCYNSLVLKVPYHIDAVKPELYRSIKQILS